jgi:hypothetical protein
VSLKLIYSSEDEDEFVDPEGIGSNVVDYHGDLRACNYPHCNKELVSWGHTTSMCPILNSRCPRCLHRGHKVEGDAVEDLYLCDQIVQNHKIFDDFALEGHLTKHRIHVPSLGYWSMRYPETGDMCKTIGFGTLNKRSPIKIFWFLQEHEDFLVDLNLTEVTKKVRFVPQNDKSLRISAMEEVIKSVVGVDSFPKVELKLNTNRFSANKFHPTMNTWVDPKPAASRKRESSSSSSGLPMPAGSGADSSWADQVAHAKGEFPTLIQQKVLKKKKDEEQLEAKAAELREAEAKVTELRKGVRQPQQQKPQLQQLKQQQSSQPRQQQQGAPPLYKKPFGKSEKLPYKGPPGHPQQRGRPQQQDQSGRGKGSGKSSSNPRDQSSSTSSSSQAKKRKKNKKRHAQKGGSSEQSKTT